MQTRTPGVLTIDLCVQQCKQIVSLVCTAAKQFPIWLNLVILEELRTGGFSLYMPSEGNPLGKLERYTLEIEEIM